MEDESMQRTVKVAIVRAGLLGLLIMAPVLGQTRTAETQFKAAQHKEEVEGDLKGAIEQYKKLAQGKDRAIAARALVRIAECYEKLGQTDARKTYEQVVRDFADQAESVNVARSRLAALSVPVKGEATQMARLIWDIDASSLTDPSESAPSSDERWLGFTDWETGDLGIRDLTTRTNRRLTNTKGWDQSGDFAEATVISPDGRQITYGWYNNQLQRYELRVLPITNSDSAQPRILHRSEDTTYVAPTGWTPDGKEVLFGSTRTDGTNQISLVPAQGGPTRVLKSFTRGHYPGSMRISPDGRYVAYDNSNGDAPARDVFVLALGNGQETAVVQHPAKDSSPLWSPDGSQLLFLSDRTGSTALWSIRIEAGKAVGNPTFVKEVMEGIYPLGLTVTRNGTLYYGTGGNANNLYLAELDSTGKASKAPTLAVETMMNHNFAGSWSRDGRYVAYYSGMNGSTSKLVIRDFDSGRERNFPLKWNPPQQNPPRWFPDGRAVLLVGRDASRDGLTYYRMDVTTGDSEMLHYTNTRGAGMRTPDLSPDGKSIFYADTVGGVAVIYRFDLDTRRATELKRGATDKIVFHSTVVSPDGKQLVYAINDRAAQSTSLEVLPTAGGPSAELFRGDLDNNVEGTLTWSPDQRYVLFAARMPSNKPPTTIWRVSVSDRKAEPIGISLQAAIKAPAIRPGGRQILFRTQENGAIQVWTLENFLPKTATR
jgi:Tol biopolymer transport system component